ncbi:hypothetical protein GALMADRAFT_231689 [Galerina marginata CBS 339.88]|uniref:ubiquitinyl hydrolase 1 n=1 Tax=Galerina marginata (strain CBS 339.88) TaxID=685588 RepID=A0A067SCS2_GALM3|nr:hypothetical protein GALMADRAFT_231689 [Galerina marginata CBS 339.88]
MTDGSDVVGSSAAGSKVVMSARNHIAFAEQYLPNLGHEVNDFKAFTWQLSNWKKLDTRLTSPNFECGGRKWRILLYPSGIRAVEPPTVSLFLDSVEPDSPPGWHKCVQFGLAVSNKHDPTIFQHSVAHHRFCHEELDWGFTYFVASNKLFEVQNGQSRPIIEMESVDITAYVRVLEDPTGVLWHNFVNYDSKKVTGYVGINNQGATGYMNIVLQTLFHNAAFRQAIYHIPTENDQPTESVALALQRVFYMLQTSDKPVGTTGLTMSFGWKSLDSFLPHDAQEFYRVLHDKLETIMKNTRTENAIERLFVGKMESYIKCINVNQEDSRIEQYSDLQLQVKGMQNIRDSLKDYTAIDILDGDYKYMTQQFGLQAAKKGITFQTFPLVLHLQLKRFEYDIQRDAMVKVQDRYEYPETLDLSEFIDGNADRSSPWIYKLHSVMVHSGNLHGGQYSVLVKPSSTSKWLKFDDDRVTPVTEKEVYEDNFGGAIQRVDGQDKDWSTNAYILVYVRESFLSEVYAPILEANIPRHISQRLEEERLQLEAKKVERENAHLYLTVKVVTSETFALHEGFDLANFEDKRLPLSDLATFQVLKEETLANFKVRLARHFDYPPSQCRLWVMVNRQNTTVRVDTRLEEYHSKWTMEVVRKSKAAPHASLRLFLENLADPSSTTPRPPQPLLIFLKHFDASKQTLLGIGHVYVSRQSTIAELVPLINKKMGWSPSTSLRLYEEIKPAMIELMRIKSTFNLSEITNGDIICFQVDIPEKESQNLTSQGLHANPVQFYDFLFNRVMITFRPKTEERGVKGEFSLMLSKKQNYDTMSAEVGEHLRHDPAKLRFTSTNASNGRPNAVVNPSLNLTVADILGVSYAFSGPVIFYEKLDVNTVEVEAKHGLKVIWTGIHNQEIATYSFLLPKTGTVQELETHLIKQVKLSRGGTGKVRFFKISPDERTQQPFAVATTIGNISGTSEIFAEEITREELDAQGSDKLIDVFHFSKEVSRTHGVPFKFVAKFGEKFLDTKRRLQARMGVPDAQVAKYRFALQVANFKQPLYLEDDDTIYDALFTPAVLGLDHIDKSGKPRAGAHPPITMR